MNRDGNVQISNLNYFVYTLVLLLIGLPLCSQALAFACALLLESSAWFSRDLVFNSQVIVTREGLISLTFWCSTAIFCFVMLTFGHMYAKYVSMPKRFIPRNALFVAFILYTLIISAIVLHAKGADIFGYHLSDILFFAFIPFVIAHVGLGPNDIHSFLLLIFLTYSLFATGVFITNKPQNQTI